MRKSRLSQGKQSRLIAYFVSGATARMAAALAGVHRNTAALYFHRLRQLISQATEDHKGMMPRITPVLFPVVAVELLYRIGGFFQDLFQKSLGRSLGLVRKNRRIQFSGEVINAHKQILSSAKSGLSLEQRQSLRVHVKHLTRIVLVVALGLGF